MKPGKTGLLRLIDAARYSLKGLKFAWTHEAAFRQELIPAIILVPAGLWLGADAVEKILLAGTCLFVLVVELLNSAIEAAVDRVGDEYHRLAGSAKDMGSAAVLISLLLAGLTWGLMLFLSFIYI
jgi:diacylglycerol kinase (ATP)